MFPPSFRFGDVQPDELFLYQGQTYKKESDFYAELLRLPSGESLDEYVSHYFEPQIVVNRLESATGSFGDIHPPVSKEGLRVGPEATGVLSGQN